MKIRIRKSKNSDDIPNTFKKEDIKSELDKITEERSL